MCRQNLCLAPEEAVGLPLGIKIGVWKTNHFSWTPKSHSGRPMGSRPKMSLLVPHCISISTVLSVCDLLTTPVPHPQTQTRSSKMGAWWQWGSRRELIVSARERGVVSVCLAFSLSDFPRLCVSVSLALTLSPAPCAPTLSPVLSLNSRKLMNGERTSLYVKVLCIEWKFSINAGDY